VDFARVAPGVALAFRCRNATSCWRVEAVPQFGTWNVVKSVRGRETRVTSLGTVPVSDGTKVAVDMDGTRLTFFVDGRRVMRIDDGDLLFETGAGLSLREPLSAPVARWSSFRMTPRSAPGALSPRDATVYDNFARNRAADLGTTPTGQRWSSVTGRWSVSGGMARSAPAPDRASLALLDVGSADGWVQATVLAPQQRSGLPFRCSDLESCWRVEVVVGDRPGNVYRVVNGKISSRGNLGIASTGPGTTVTVEMHGAKLVFFVNGMMQRTITDDTFSSEHGAGFVVEPGPFSGATRWSEFAAKPDPRP